jgi:hypothetical protein
MTETITAPAQFDASKIKSVKLAELPALVAQLAESVKSAETQDAREGALQALATATARAITTQNRPDGDTLVHVTKEMDQYSSNTGRFGAPRREGLTGQGMRYSKERAALLAHLASTQGVAAASRNARYRYSGGRRQQVVELFGYQSDIDRTLTMWDQLNTLLTKVAFGIEMDAALAPQAQTRLRRIELAKWVEEVAGQIEGVVQDALDTTPGAANRASDRFTEATALRDEWMRTVGLEQSQDEEKKAKTDVQTAPSVDVEGTPDEENTESDESDESDEDESDEDAPEDVEEDRHVVEHGAY